MRVDYRSYIMEIIYLLRRKKDDNQQELELDYVKDSKLLFNMKTLKLLQLEIDVENEQRIAEQMEANMHEHNTEHTRTRFKQASLRAKASLRLAEKTRAELKPLPDISREDDIDHAYLILLKRQAIVTRLRATYMENGVRKHHRRKDDPELQCAYANEKKAKLHYVKLLEKYTDVVDDTDDEKDDHECMAICWCK